MDSRWKSMTLITLGAFGGWLGAYPLAMLTLWGMAGDSAGPLFAELVSGNLPQFLGRLLPVNLISAGIGAGVGLLVHRALRARRDLQDREARFRNMAASAPDAIIVMGRDGRISFWNAAAEKIFGYRLEEALGLDLHRTLVPERFHGAFESGWEAFRETGRGHAIGNTLELAARRKDGGEFPIELSLSAFRLRGEWHAMGIVRDISDRKRAEEERVAREKLEGVLEMAGAASHNMNQPLQSLLWHTQALLEELPAEDYLHKELRLIKEQVDKMRAISAKIMKITRYRTVGYYRDIKIIDIDQASEKTRTPPADDEPAG